MNKILIYLLFVSTLMACEITIEKKKSTQKTIIETPEIKCQRYSEEMLAFIQNLKDNQYQVKIDTTGVSFKLRYLQNESLNILERSSYTGKVSTFYFKSTQKLENMEGNWYPRFEVREVCFLDNDKAIQYANEFNLIYNGIDNAIKKGYFHLFAAQNKLITIYCNANIFIPEAKKYQIELENIYNQ